ncbi:MAG: hypothetical protein ACXW2U_00840 [Telluria sp.]
MSETQSYKKPTLFGFGENCVIALSRSILVLQLIDKAEIEKLADNLHEATKASNAEGAVDITVLVSYADLHALVLNGFFGACLGFDNFHDRSIELRYVFSDDQGRQHAIPHSQIPYFEKYVRSVAA